MTTKQANNRVKRGWSKLIRNWSFVSILLLMLLGSSACGSPTQVARIKDGGFQVFQGNEWKPFYVKGINFSLGMPGFHPGSFSAKVEQYKRYMELLGKMNANVIRIYTLQPPVFYRELRAYNLKHPDKPLWLMQGVWLDEAPESEGDYLKATETTSRFRQEIEWVTDAIHGNATIGERKGWAYGTYNSDVSRWTIGLLLGREMDPYIVLETNEKNPKLSSHKGKYITIEGVSAIEVWAVQMLNHAITYEQEKYGVQRPVAMSSWATLDPLNHPSEPRAPESSEDTAVMNLKNMKLTEAATAGVFISYHAYPYYPNFINLNPRYNKHVDHIGNNPYEAYLKELKAHYGDIPVLIAEYGLPASMGSVHTSSSGMNHGVQNEQIQADGVVRMTENIRRAGLPGGCVFAWIDEWFKRTWALDPLQERARINKWHNKLSPEEHFGVIAVQAYRKGGTVKLGDAKTWVAKPLFQRTAQTKAARKDDSPYAAMRQLQSLRAQHDAAYLFLQFKVKALDPDGDGSINWSKVNYLVGIDTYDSKLGESKLHKDLDKLKLQGRVEFRLRIQSNDDNTPKASLEVAAPYDLYGIWHDVREPWQKYKSMAVDKGEFNPIRWIMEIALSNPQNPKELLQKRQNFDLGTFRYGHQVPKKAGFDPLAHFYADIKNNTISVRIPWTLLNVKDPSRRQIFHDDPDTKGYDPKETKGFRFTVAALRPNGEGKAPSLIDVLPAGPAPEGQTTTVPLSPIYTWDFWDSTDFRERLRPIYYALQKKFAELP